MDSNLKLPTPAVSEEKLVKLPTPAATQNYPGGKNQDGVYQRIINLIPPHRIWVECCAGSAAITKRIRPTEESYCIEMDLCQVHMLEKDLPEHVILSQGDFMELLSLDDLASDSYFLFIDPPYMIETRTSKAPIYKHEWNMQDHIAFLLWIKEVKCPVLITHPICELYLEVIGHWYKVQYEYMSHAGKRSDCIWMNYPHPIQLHDYSYLGTDRTERQQINRLENRWINRFNKLSPKVKGKIMASLQENFNNLKK